MSWVEVHEFEAVDRGLSDEERSALRTFSSRAKIERSGFHVSYHYGSPRFHPFDLLLTFFDIHVYRDLMGHVEVLFRLPSEVVSAKDLKGWPRGTTLSITDAHEWTVIGIRRAFEDARQPVDDPVRWVTGDKENVYPYLDAFVEERSASDLVEARETIMVGDERVLYIAWLLGIQTREVSAGAKEPPVPAGLADLPPSICSLCTLLRIDEHLLEAAAEASGERAEEGDHLAEWLAAVPASEKDEWLLRMTHGERVPVRALLYKRFARRSPRTPPGPRRRTATELAQRALDLRRAAEERAARKAAAEERQRIERRLAALRARGERAWSDVDEIMQRKNSVAYREAIALLLDLRLLAVEQGDPATFEQRLSTLRDRYARRPAFLALLDTSKLVSISAEAAFTPPRRRP